MKLLWCRHHRDTQRNNGGYWSNGVPYSRYMAVCHSKERCFVSEEAEGSKTKNCWKKQKSFVFQVVQWIKIAAAIVAWLFKNGGFVQDVPCHTSDDSSDNSLWPISGLQCFHLLVAAQLAWNLDRGDTKKSIWYYPQLLPMENQKRTVPSE